MRLFSEGQLALRTLNLSLSYSAVNAASKGHLPVVLYLLTKQQADPLVRNNWGETAYDVAAAVFEVWICEVSLYRHVIRKASSDLISVGTATVRIREVAGF